MILVGRYTSPFARRVAVSLRHLGFDYEHRAINAWNNLSEMRRFNPVGRVPALVLDDGEVLFDSNAILDYLDAIVGPQRALIPASEPERRAIMRYVVCAMGALEKMVHSVYEVTMHPPEKVHLPWIDHNLGQTALGLKWLDENTGTPWTAGKRFSQADITTTVVASFAAARFPERFPAGTFPNLEKLIDCVTALPAWQETQPSPEEAKMHVGLPVGDQGEVPARA
jgi:glutathione S-transferase